MAVILERAQAAWAALIGGGAGFEDGRLCVVVDPDPWVVRAGSATVVTLGDGAVAVAPDAVAAAHIRSAAGDTHPRRLSDLDWAGAGATTIRGPAALLFGPGSHLGPAPAPPITQLAPADPRVRALIDRAGDDEAAESGLAHVTSPVFAAAGDGGTIVAGAGYRLWPHGIAHLSVLTDPRQRRAGHGSTAAAAAIAHAVEAGLLPQWRARHRASQRLARSIGLELLGAQVSFDLPSEPAR